MTKVLLSLKKNMPRGLLLLLVLFLIMFFLNTGFLVDAYWKIIQAFIFAIVFTIILIWPQFKKTIFVLAFMLIILMVPLYVKELIETSDILGSTGFGFVIINLLSYLPQFVKLGYIKKL